MLNVPLLQSGWSLHPRYSVTLRRQTAPRVYGDTTQRNAFRLARTTKEAEESEGAALASEVEWYLVKRFTPAAPNPGDVLVHEGVNHTVLEVGEAGGLGAWKLDTIRLHFNGALDDVVTLLRPTLAATADGFRRATPLVAVPGYENIPAKLQPVDSFSGGAPITAGDRVGKRVNPETVRCYLGARLVETTGQDVIRNEADGALFSLLNVVAPAKLAKFCGVDLLKLS